MFLAENPRFEVFLTGIRLQGGFFEVFHAAPINMDLAPASTGAITMFALRDVARSLPGLANTELRSKQRTSVPNDAGRQAKTPKKPTLAKSHHV